MITKAVVGIYSKMLGLDQVELYIDDVLIARANGDKIDVMRDIKSGQSCMVTVSDAIGIAHTFFHCDEVTDQRSEVRMG